MKLNRIIMGAGVAFLAVFACVILFNAYAAHVMRVGNENYSRIVGGKDLLADILPPPLYIIEPYLEARLAFADPGTLHSHPESLGKLRKECNARHAFWMKSKVIEETVKKGVLIDAYGEAKKFWAELEAEFLPNLAKGDLSRAEQSLKLLHQHYSRHRSLIDNGAVSANTMVAQTEAIISKEGE